MTLKDRLIERIARTGPMTVADYMTECLLHPEHGYYTTGDPLGGAGDFITAPEISQMFGELLGVWLAQVWMDQGAPSPFNLVELGPGRGTLMADALRATRSVPGFHGAMQLHLVEASPTLRMAQEGLLSDFAPNWHETLATVPDGPLFLVANEFFDALPIRQYQRGGADGWHERMIGADGENLIWGLSPPSTVAALSERLHNVSEGQIVELCPAGEAIAGEIGRRVAAFGGAALIIDYGDWASIGDTFQAMAGHAYADPLADPGGADLTAHVAFGALARAANPAVPSALTPQGVLLKRLGITPRAQTLLKGLSGLARDQLVAAHRRLTHPEEMGNLFKVLALMPPSAAPPPGLDPQGPAA